MKQNKVGYCWSCGEETVHRVIECEDSAIWRTFEVVATCGFGALFEHDYKCQCTKCGKIRTLSF